MNWFLELLLGRRPVTNLQNNSSNHQNASSQRDQKPIRKVLLVGHCGADSGSLGWLAQQAMGLEAIRVNSDSDLRLEASQDTLLWINRVLDGHFDAADGVALVKELALGVSPPPMMLITNYADVQQAAIDAGALPGFGKNDIGDPALVDRLKKLAQSPR